MSESTALQYLRPEEGSFWNWDDGGQSISLCGETLTFHQELELVLAHLQPHGLPSLTEVLLLLAACRRNWHAPDGPRERVDSFFHGRISDAEDANFQPEDTSFFTAGVRLDLVHHLARKHDFRQEAVLAIFECAYESFGHQLEPEEAAEVVEAMRRGDVAILMQEERSTRTPRDLPLGVATSLENVGLALKGLSPNEDLDSRIRTGIPGQLSAAELQELPYPERLAEFLEELKLDTYPDLSGLARIVRNLTAVVHLPRPLSMAEEMPMGGFSDISNKGSLERLLLSELAHEDDVLAVRVALNEALYLRRESPPRHPPTTRAILLDPSVRLWGLPRLFATAAGMAIALQSDRLARLEVYTHEGGKLMPAGFHDRKSLQDLLSRLSTEPHPGAALRSFLRQLEDQESGMADAVLITHPRVLEDPHFREALTFNANVPLFLATVDGNGVFTLRAHGSHGERQLQHIQLDLKKLLAGPQSVRSKDQPILRNRSAAFPKILRLREFPLLLTPPFKDEHAHYREGMGLVFHNREGILLHRPSMDRGAWLLTDEFPPGVTSWSELDEKKNRALFFFPRSDMKGRLLIADLENRSTELVEIYHGLTYVRGIYREDELLVLVGDWQVVVCRIEDGQPVCQQNLPDRWKLQSGRFAKLGHAWYAISAGSDREVHFESLPDHSPVHVWERKQSPAPLALFADLSVRCLTDPPEDIVHGTDLRFRNLLGISSDGERLHVATQKEGSINPVLMVVDVTKAHPQPRPGDTARAIEPMIVRFRETAGQLRKSYRFIFVTAPGNLHIISTRGGYFTLRLVTQGFRRIEWQKENDHGRPIPAQMRDGIADHRSFERTASPNGTRFHLHVAEWPDGSKAWLDSRSMLHLKSSDPGIPEVTLLMKDGMLSGWTSAGQHFGNVMYIGDHKSQPLDGIYAHIEAFCQRILTG